MTCYCGDCPSCNDAQGIYYRGCGDRAESECMRCGALIPSRYALCEECSALENSMIDVEEIEIEEIEE
jgi:hypothetical protein